MKKVLLFCLTISVAILIGVLTNVAAIKLLQMAVDLRRVWQGFRHACRELSLCDSWDESFDEGVMF